MPHCFMCRVTQALVFALLTAIVSMGCKSKVQTTQPNTKTLQSNVVKTSNPIEVVRGGNEIDINKHLANGKITLVEFYADWCGPCKMISPALENMARTDRDIALCKIDIVNWTSPVTRQYNIRSIPCVVVFDRKGQMVGVMRGVDPDALNQYITQAKES
jgi:thioredoxin